MDDRLSGDSGLVIEDFFDDYDEFRQYLDLLDYRGETNPKDGVWYPGVSVAIPEYFRSQVELKVGTPTELFLRLSPEGQETPHQAHHDGIMAKYTMVIYLNRAEHCQGGTSILTHVSGEEPTEEVWRRDTNQPEQWIVKSQYVMEPNRCVIYPSEWWHRSEPVGGFGHVPKNARLVMVGFFDELKISDV
jgi:hypothetical protein